MHVARVRGFAGIANPTGFPAGYITITETMHAITTPKHENAYYLLLALLPVCTRRSVPSTRYPCCFAVPKLQLQQILLSG